jgi:exodeoxyribonuclease V alpha subunit
MLRRNLLYTALTRGRRFVVLIGPASAVRAAVANDQEQVRRSHLARKLRGGGQASPKEFQRLSPALDF